MQDHPLAVLKEDIICDQSLALECVAHMLCSDSIAYPDISTACET